MEKTTQDNKPYEHQTYAVNWNEVPDSLDLEVWNRANANVWWPERIPISNDLPASRLLLPEERLALTRALVGLTYLDTLQAEKGLPGMQDDVAGDRKRQHELHVYKQFEFMECLTSEHELLTPTGWKGVADITKEDLVAQYNPETNGVSFVHPVEISSHFSEKTIRIYNEHGDIYQRVSPKHRVYVEVQDPETHYNRGVEATWSSKVYHAEDLLDQQLHPQIMRFRNTGQLVRFRNAGQLDNGVEREFTAIDALLVAIQADGNVNDSKEDLSSSETIPVNFSFSKQRKIDRIYKLAKEAGWTISKPKDSIRDINGKLNLNLMVPKEYLEIGNKRFENWWNLNEVSLQWCRSFVDELQYWDDTKLKDHDIITYSSYDKVDADFVIAIANLAGYKTCYKVRVRVDERSPNFKDIHSVTIIRSHSTTSEQGIRVELDEGDMVYGIEVPSTYLIVKAAGGVIVTGNCVHAKSYSSIFTTLLTTQEIRAAFLWSEQNKYLQHKGYLITEKYVGKCPLERRQASVWLESFMFYSGFFYPLLLNDTRKLSNTADVIKLIARDEAVHGYYIGAKYQQMLKDVSPQRRQELEDLAYTSLIELFENEVKYAQELYEPVGLVEQVIKYMELNANRALRNLGYDPLFSTTAQEVNPIVLKGLSNGVNHDFFSLAGSSYTMLNTGNPSEEIMQLLRDSF